MNFFNYFEFTLLYLPNKNSFFCEETRFFYNNKKRLFNKIVSKKK